jgi:hypothetical protein
MEDRPARHGELAATARALPSDGRLGERIDLQNAAMRTERLAIIGSKSNALERFEHLLVGQPKNLSYAQAPCRGTDKKMLWQGGQSLSRGSALPSLWKSSANSTIFHETIMTAGANPGVVV